MDILRKELEEIYHSQKLDKELLPPSELADSLRIAENIVDVNMGCSVITDAAADYCYVYSGWLGQSLGLSKAHKSSFSAPSSDEDEIYELIHPEDLVDKRLLEYEFFKLVDIRNSDEKKDYIAFCLIRMRRPDGSYIRIANSTQVICLSPAGKIWLILCTYTLSPFEIENIGISPTIICSRTAERIPLNFTVKRKEILSEREKEVLKLIRDGRPSKQIADILGISINTVNRHRQNILEKLCVGNSVEAVTAATLMKLL